MKSLNEILIMLVAELVKHRDYVNSENQKLYYNEDLGDTSFLLAGVLQRLMNEFKDWDKRKWFDDSLITKVLVSNHKILLEGVMILGIEDTTEQWTEPFCFEISLSKNKYGYKEYTFLFSDISKPELSYEKFNINRHYWDSSSNRNWRYVIRKKSIVNS